MARLDLQGINWQEKIVSREGNRILLRSRTDKVKASLEKHGYWPGYPIIINTRWECIAGQHRLQACKELGITPVVEMLDDISVQMLVDIETAQGVWTIMEKLEAHKTCGNKAASIITKLCEDFKSCPKVVALALERDGNINRLIQTTISDEEDKTARRNFKEFSIFAVTLADEKVYFNARLMAAFLTMKRKPGFDLARFRDRMKGYGREMFVSCNNAKAQTSNLVDIYNFHTPAALRLSH